VAHLGRGSALDIGGPGPAARLDHAHRPQCPDDFAQQRAADLQLRRQLPFRRQTFARCDGLAIQPGGKLIKRGLEDIDPRDRLQLGHGFALLATRHTGQLA